MQRQQTRELELLSGAATGEICSAALLDTNAPDAPWIATPASRWRPLPGPVVGA